MKVVAKRAVESLFIDSCLSGGSFKNVYVVKQICSKSGQREIETPL